MTAHSANILKITNVVGDASDPSPIEADRLKATDVTGNVVQELQARTSGKRFLSLDSLRGLAAVVVIWHHFRFAFTDKDPQWYLKPFFAGHSAVILFFVLSGYVLSLPVWRGRQPAYGAYLVRRFFRIYVPYAVAIGLAIIVARPMLFAHLPLSQWFYQTWHTPLSADLILRQFFLMSTSPAINTAAWSLRYEMEMSIVFPFICALILRLGAWISFLLAIATFEVALHIPRHMPNAFGDELCTTLQFTVCFILGALAAFKSQEIRFFYERIPRLLKLLAFAAVAFCYLAPPKPILLPFAACGVLIFALHSVGKRLLDHRLPEYFGRISYSLYLTHGTVLFALLILLYGRVPFLALVFIYAACCFAVAHLFCVLVEEPALRLGKRLSQMIQTTPAISS